MGVRIFHGSRKVTVLANSSHEEVDSTCRLDLLLICRTFGYEILSISVKDVDVFLRYVNMVEEGAGHE